MRIPPTAQIVGDKVEKMPKIIKDLIEDCENNAEVSKELDNELDLRRAEIHNPSGGAKDIIRVFETDQKDVFVLSNFEYSLIEKSNGLEYYEDDNLKAMVVFENYKGGRVEGIIVELKEDK